MEQQPNLVADLCRLAGALGFEATLEAYMSPSLR
jgi:hypothetical protein